MIWALPRYGLEWEASGHHRPSFGANRVQDRLREGLGPDPGRERLPVDADVDPAIAFAADHLHRGRQGRSDGQEAEAGGENAEIWMLREW
jgi:hypothetical protein